MSPDFQATVKELVRGLSPADILQLLNNAQNANLQEAETSKDHPLKGQQLEAKDFAALASHMLDGGGVINKADLARSLATQLLKREQESGFWDNLIHYVKASLRADGVISALPVKGGEGTPVVMHGVSKLTQEDFRQQSNRFRKIEEA